MKKFCFSCQLDYITNQAYCPLCQKELSTTRSLEKIKSKETQRTFNSTNASKYFKKHRCEICGESSSGLFHNKFYCQTHYLKRMKGQTIEEIIQNETKKYQ